MIYLHNNICKICYCSGKGNNGVNNFSQNSWNYHDEKFVLYSDQIFIDFSI